MTEARNYMSLLQCSNSQAHLTALDSLLGSRASSRHTLLLLLHIFTVDATTAAHLVK